MTKNGIEKAIETHISRFYQGNEQAVENWYRSPWLMTDRKHANGRYYTPREMISSGRADEVLKLLTIILR